jgi:hypothetical protein
MTDAQQTWGVAPVILRPSMNGNKLQINPSITAVRGRNFTLPLAPLVIYDSAN